MIPQTLVVVLIGVGIGYLYYMMRRNEEEERQYGYHNSRPSTPVYNGYHNSRPSTPEYNGYQNRRSSNNSYIPCPMPAECSICFEPIPVTDMIELPSCLHMFHKKCIIEWKTMGPSDVRDTCPLCRGSS